MATADIGSAGIDEQLNQGQGARPKQRCDGQYARAVKLRESSREGNRKGSKGSISEGDGRRAQAWKYEECEKLFRKDNDMVLECEYCEKHYCIKCLRYKQSEYEAMAKPECMWFCLACKPKIEKNILNEKMIEERCLFYCQSINDRLEEVEKQLRTKCDETKVKELIKEMEGVHVKPKGQVMQAPNTVESDNIIQEMNDRKAREANFLIFRAPEPETNLKEVREKADSEFVHGLCNEVCRADIDVNTDIVKIIRLGKKEGDVAGEGRARTRPMLVVMRNVDTKERIFKSLSNLKGAEDKYRSLSIQHDQTKKQREEEKKLIEEAKAKEMADVGKTNTG